MILQQMNDKLKTTWKELVVAKFNEKYRYVTRETEEPDEKSVRTLDSQAEIWTRDLPNTD